MKRLLPLIVAIGLLVAACGGSDSVAATVNGDEITDAQVYELIGEDVEPTDQFVVDSLNTLIQWTVTEQAALDSFGFEPTDDDIQTEIDDVVASTGATSFSDLAESQGIPEHLLRRYVIQLMTRDAIRAAIEEGVEDPSDDEVTSQLEDSAPDWTTVCVSHLLVATEDEANAALERIEGGEAFADVATDVSTDTGSAVSGGDLGCNLAGGFVEPFADAAMTADIDQVTGPVESEFGFHVLVVSSREVATEDEVRSSLRDAAVVEAADAWFLAALSSADVVVTDGFGVWTTDPSPQVIVAS